jgi:hypothetical protein
MKEKSGCAKKLLLSLSIFPKSNVVQMAEERHRRGAAGKELRSLSCESQRQNNFQGDSNHAISAADL